MDTTFVQEMKQKLLEEQKLLNSQLNTISSPDTGDHVPGDRNPTFPNYGDDALNEDSESPAEVADYSLNVSVTGTLESQLNAVHAALKRIEDGTYGICTNCGKDIAPERLRVNPSAEACVNCARAHA